ncbi:Uncharacterized membrane protein, UPF0136 family [Armatimonadetes bacterium GBS]|jgi:uncharacterized membrane protein (UPF0136 family)|nr:hypothetical protein HRbin14_01764 [bacterium HR14]GIV14010.1 MAG: hypothetical protein KatS3mg021_2292 [Fimbriimonadales bacterium]CUU03087.1 Uncharacterized membrane protein, UPF0136 family [Armatimonadetes bacterium GBS]CUU35059.1 Uncharacterized membrane protein, UPF0136 family [Armatimonadetes bacterium GXS]
MNVYQIILLIYLLVVAGGGVMGYVSAQSTASLIVGLASGVLLAIALWLSFSNPKLGFGMAAVVALALAVFFTMRFLNTGKWMPGGISMILSGLTFILMLVALLRKE